MHRCPCPQLSTLRSPSSLLLVSLTRPRRAPLPGSWSTSDGGALRCFEGAKDGVDSPRESDQCCLEVEPHGGTAIFFPSCVVPHQVKRPATLMRRLATLMLIHNHSHCPPPGDALQATALRNHAVAHVTRSSARHAGGTRGGRGEAPCIALIYRLYVHLHVEYPPRSACRVPRARRVCGCEVARHSSECRQAHRQPNP